MYKTQLEKRMNRYKRQLKKGKANFEAEMEFLTCQMELEACIVQTNVLKSEYGSVKAKLNLPEDDPLKRVENFVNEYPQ